MAAHLVRGKNYYLWVTVFFLTIGAMTLGLYYATLQIDYVWRWFRVPQYFFYEETIEIKSESDGNIVSVSKQDKETVIVIKDNREEKTYKTLAEKVSVKQGDLIFAGDLLASYKKWRIGILLEGLWVTLKVSFVAIIFGIIIGLFTGLARISTNPALRWLSIAYIELIRGSPLLVQIFIWHFVLGTLINTLLAKQGIGQIPPIWFGEAALAVFTGAYVAEIARAGIQSIHRGQTEASRSLGMTYVQSMVHVILPQAMRRILPPLAGQFISLIKDSSLLGIIAIRELSKATREIVTTSLQPFELWFMCALLYLVLTFALSMFVQYLERKMVI